MDFVRTEGLYPGATRHLRTRLRALSLGPEAAELGDEQTRFVAGQARRTRRGESLPGSSEVIETCFGKFKA